MNQADGDGWKVDMDSQTNIPPGSDNPLYEAVARTEGLQPGRRVFHAFTGLTFAAVLYLLTSTPNQARWLFGGLLVVLLAADIARLTIPSLNLAFFRMFRLFASPRELAKIASSTWYVVGVLILCLFFPTGTWVPAVLVLALGDPSASYVGRRWGRRKLGGGTVLGSAAFYGVTAIVLAFFCPLPVALLVAACVAAVEALPRFVVDDNVTIPVATAGFMWLLGCA